MMTWTTNRMMPPNSQPIELPDAGPITEVDLWGTEAQPAAGRVAAVCPHLSAVCPHWDRIVRRCDRAVCLATGQVPGVRP